MPSHQCVNFSGILNDDNLILITPQNSLSFFNNFTRWLLICTLSVVLVSCGDSFEKSYYEKVTRIKFPDNYKFVATADNGEYLTITILDLDKKDCKKFIADNNFQSISDFFPKMIGLGYLDSSLRKLPDRKLLLMNYHDKQPGKTGWMYFIDTTNCRLYCEIDYPDSDGN